MTPQHPSRSPSRPRWALSLLAALALSACGGGGDGGGNPGPLVYTKGTVEGLGSVIVNGVRYDDAQARVLDEEGRASTRDALKLGMVVEVVAASVQAGADGRLHGQAQEIRHASEIQGPIDSLGTNEMVVLGQTVRHDAATLFEDGRAATLRVGQVVEVHGLRDPQGVVLASRIDTEDDRDEAHKLVATVSGHEPVARSFMAGGARVSYAALPNAALENGQVLRIRLAPQPLASGAWQATAITPLQAVSPLASGASASAGAAGVEADIEGYVTRVDGPRRFVVAGVQVDASNARQFPASVAVGSLVEVGGRLVGGVLVASEVELERRLGSGGGFEIEGRITALDLAASRFEVRGLVVHFGAARFAGGSAQRLALGTEVEVRGTLSADGASVNASVVEFD